MRSQPQSMSGSTSHFPFLAPPHWPLTRLLEQAVIGQMPPVRFRSVVQPRFSLSRNTTPAPPSEVSLPPVKVLMAAWMRRSSFLPSSMKAWR